jgi:pyruvate formate lyase activating enzyme
LRIRSGLRVSSNSSSVSHPGKPPRFEAKLFAPDPLIFKGWQKTSLIEYPGKISSVVFAGGCNFRCPFCYNGDLIERPHELGDLEPETVLRYLTENAGLYQALVISGGEPTLYAQLPEFLRRVKALDLCVGLETNGTNPKMVERMLEQDLLDYVAMDVKAPLDWDAYRRAAGLPRESGGMLVDVKQTLRLLRDTQVEVELRCTVVPRVHEPKDILRLAEQLQGHRGFVLQQFVPERALDVKMRNQSPYGAEVLSQLCKRIGGLIPCEVRGV